MAPSAVTPEQKRAEYAYGLEVEVLAAVTHVRRSWVPLAQRLYEFHAAKAWEALGHESFTVWLGGPEVGLAKRTGYRLVELWRDLAVERGVPPEALARVDIAKLDTVLPALRRGDIDTATALADAEALSKSDLVEKYRGTPAPRSGLETCPDCGLERRAA